MSQPKRLYDRIDHGWSGHPWASRDWQDIDCNAIGCKWNRDRKCNMPSLAVIGKVKKQPPDLTAGEFNRSE